MINIKTFQSGSSGNLHLITIGKSRLLIECGLSIKKIKEHLGFDLDIDLCLLSHCHADHSKSAKKIIENGIELVCSEETAQILEIDNAFTIFGPTTIKEWFITPYPTIHDTQGSLCFVIEREGFKILFATDTFDLPYILNGLTHIIIECNHSSETMSKQNKYLERRIVNTHMSLKKCCSFLDNNDLSKVEEIHLIHLSARNANADFFKTEVQKLTGIPVFIG